jgi:hypothetical protein
MTSLSSGLFVAEQNYWNNSIGNWTWLHGYSASQLRNADAHESKWSQYLSIYIYEYSEATRTGCPQNKYEFESKRQTRGIHPYTLGILRYYRKIKDYLEVLRRIEQFFPQQPAVTSYVFEQICRWTTVNVQIPSHQLERVQGLKFWLEPYEKWS